MGVADLDSLFRSPGEALFARAQMQAQLISAAETASNMFLVRVRTATVRGELSPRYVMDEWEKVVERVAGRVPADFRGDVRTFMGGSGLPDRAYETAWQVQSEALAGRWSRSKLNEELKARLPTNGWVRNDMATVATRVQGAYSAAMINVMDVSYKRWVTRHDDAVREAHADADGQTVPSGQLFVIGGSSLRWPGDPDAPLELTMNCRCVLIGLDRPRTGLATEALG